MSGPAAASAPDAALFFRWRSSGMLVVGLGGGVAMVVVVLVNLTGGGGAGDCRCEMIRFGGCAANLETWLGAPRFLGSQGPTGSLR